MKLKQQVATELSRRGFEVMFEFRLADVVGFHLQDGIVLAIEIELSSRNVVSNLLRNLGNGFRSIFIAVSARNVIQVERLIAPHVANAGRGSTVSVFGIDDELLGLCSLLGKIFSESEEDFKSRDLPGVE